MQQKLEGIVTGTLPDLTQAGYEVAKARDIAAIGRQLKRQYEAVLENGAE